VYKPASTPFSLLPQILSRWLAALLPNFPVNLNFLGDEIKIIISISAKICE
jgi:hypothetical protein